MDRLATFFQFGSVTLTAMAIAWLLPFVLFLVLSTLPAAHKKAAHWATINMLLSFVASIVGWLAILSIDELHVFYPWLQLSSLQVELSFYLNFESVTFFVVVNFVALCVHLFSIVYMKDDPRIARYFAYLGLFTFAMGGIVFSHNLLIVFVFWELVGFSSYLLIGFWRHKPTAAAAAKKAFIINRVGDTGFMIAIMIIAAKVGHFDMEVFNFLEDTHPFKQDHWWYSLAGLGIIAGVVGKSAQFPLMNWLPDAMEGPTPVSALIHAATMVAAGVYLLSRLFGFFSADVMLVMAVVGVLTAFMGAIAAMNQRDIKKVLAYSTVSQLGYMVMAMGLGAYHAGFMHLLAHAFFKAGLFLSAGAIIHYLHQLAHQHNIQFDAQDMHRMGGLKQYMPITFLSYSLCMFALIGLPFFSGFLTKDAILLSAFNFSIQQGYWFIPVLAFGTVFLTAFYMGRQWFWVFWGKNNLVQEELVKSNELSARKEGNWQIKLPIILLALASLFPIISLQPFSFDHSYWLPRMNAFAYQAVEKWHLAVAIMATVLSIIGFTIAYLMYKSKTIDSRKLKKNGVVQLISLFSMHNWFLDALQDGLIRRPINFISRQLDHVDKKVFDGAIRYLALIHILNVHILAWIDQYIIDGIVRTSGQVAMYIGGKIRALNASSIHSYLIFTLFVLLIIIYKMLF